MGSFLRWLLSLIVLRLQSPVKYVKINLDTPRRWIVLLIHGAHSPFAETQYHTGNYLYSPTFQKFPRLSCSRRAFLDSVQSHKLPVCLKRFRILRHSSRRSIKKRASLAREQFATFPRYNEVDFAALNFAVVEDGYVRDNLARNPSQSPRLRIGDTDLTPASWYTTVTEVQGSRLSLLETRH